LPGINFTTFGGLTDPTPRRELDQTYTFSDTVSWYRGKHNWRFGGDYRRILQSFRSAKNAEGTFVFTGFETAQFAPGSVQPVSDTGYDFADFLLGLPQQTTLQSGTNSYDFRANSFDLFAQDDWRMLSKLSLNLGFRYEYNGPYTEAHNHIANLDVASGFTAAVPVLPGAAGTFNGTFPTSLIRPDRNNYAPRIGVAWRPLKQTVVRAGYGVNYNLAQYANIIQNFAFQPPFAVTATNVSSAANSLTLQNGFPAATAGSVTNNFAVDPNYRLGYVQIWNLDIQRTLPHGFVLNVDYNGSKGTRLDTERAIQIPRRQCSRSQASGARHRFQRKLHLLQIHRRRFLDRRRFDRGRAKSVRHRRGSRAFCLRSAPQIHGQLDRRFALRREPPLRPKGSLVAHLGWLAVEWRLHPGFRLVLHATRSRQQPGYQSRRQRLAARRRHRCAHPAQQPHD
jgi:hypothetical protein